MTPVSTRRPRATLLIVLALTGAMLVLGTGVGHAFQISQPAVVSADPVNFTPNITNGKVEAIVQVGNRMIVAGTFTQAQNAGSTTTLTRNRILAFNATTGVIDTAFNPNVNGEITSMVVAPGGTAVIIAGTFTSVGGVGGHSDREARCRDRGAHHGVHGDRCRHRERHGSVGEQGHPRWVSSTGSTTWHAPRSRPSTPSPARSTRTSTCR